MSFSRVCPSCQRRVSLFQMTGSGLCGVCANQPDHSVDVRAVAAAAAEAEIASRVRAGEHVDWASAPTKLVAEYAAGIPLTTAHDLPSFRILRTVTVISAETALGLNVFRDIANMVRDTFGGRSETLQMALRVNRETCLTELRREALLVGANGVIGIDLDYSEFSSTAVSGGMLLTVATGTAVVVEALQ